MRAFGANAHIMKIFHILFVQMRIHAKQSVCAQIYIYFGLMGEFQRENCVCGARDLSIFTELLILLRKYYDLFFDNFCFTCKIETFQESFYFLDMRTIVFFSLHFNIFCSMDIFDLPVIKVFCLYHRQRAKAFSKGQLRYFEPVW